MYLLKNFWLWSLPCAPQPKKNLAVDPSMCATAKNNFGCGLFSVCSFWLWTYKMQKWLWNLSGPHRTIDYLLRWKFNLSAIVRTIGNMSDLIWSIGYDYTITTMKTSPSITDDDDASVITSCSGLGQYFKIRILIF